MARHTVLELQEALPTWDVWGRSGQADSGDWEPPGVQRDRPSLADTGAREGGAWAVIRGRGWWGSGRGPDKETGGRHSRGRAQQRLRPGRASRVLREALALVQTPSPAIPLGPMEMTPLSADRAVSMPTWNHPEPKREENWLWPGSCLAALESRVS